MTVQQVIDVLRDQVEMFPDLAHQFAIEAQSEWDYFESIFRLAGIKVLDHYELPNHYWPTAYVKLRAENPWWLAKTEWGLIQIGWRKRVISIEWDWEGVEAITTDNVTKYSKGVHADSNIKAIEYLQALGAALTTSRPTSPGSVC